MNRKIPQKCYLTENDAVSCWMARFLRQFNKRNPQLKLDSLCARYGSVSARRIYEVWERKKFRRSKDRAIRLFEKLFPELRSELDTSDHVPKFKREPIEPNRNQYDLFS